MLSQILKILLEPTNSRTQSKKIQSNSNVLFKLHELHQRCKMRFSYPTYVLSFSYPMRTKEIIVLSCQHNLAGTQQINLIEVFRQSLSFLQSQHILSYRFHPIRSQLETVLDFWLNNVCVKECELVKGGHTFRLLAVK